MVGSPSDITYFIETAQTQNISKAAQQLGISQPSLSIAIQRLELSLETTLFIRSKRGVILTKAGEQFLAHSTRMLEFWDNIKTETLNIVNEVQGIYTIGCHTSVALDTVGLFLPSLMKRYPKLNIHLKHDLSRKITEDIINFKIDIGIVVNPIQHPDLIISPLYKDEVSIWASSTLKKDNSIIICDPSLTQSQQILKQLKKGNVHFYRMVTSSNLEVILSLIENGVGVGILPKRVASRAQNTLIPFVNTPIIYDDHCLITRVENKDIKSIAVIKNAIKSVTSRKC